VSIINAVLIAAAAYGALGIVFAAPFVLVGANRIDAAARGASWGFRLIVVPGVVALWPVLAWFWLRGRAHPERNEHRDRAREVAP
jgi:hypothetical protein